MKNRNYFTTFKDDLTVIVKSNTFTYRTAKLLFNITTF